MLTIYPCELILSFSFLPNDGLLATFLLNQHPMCFASDLDFHIEGRMFSIHREWLRHVNVAIRQEIEAV